MPEKPPPFESRFQLEPGQSPSEKKSQIRLMHAITGAIVTATIITPVALISNIGQICASPDVSILLDPVCNYLKTLRKPPDSTPTSDTDKQTLATAEAEARADQAKKDAAEAKERNAKNQLLEASGHSNPGQGSNTPVPHQEQAAPPQKNTATPAPTPPTASSKEAKVSAPLTSSMMLEGRTLVEWAAVPLDSDDAKKIPIFVRREYFSTDGNTATNLIIKKLKLSKFNLATNENDAALIVHVMDTTVEKSISDASVTSNKLMPFIWKTRLHFSVNFSGENTIIDRKITEQVLGDAASTANIDSIDAAASSVCKFIFGSFR